MVLYFIILIALWSSLIQARPGSYFPRIISIPLDRYDTPDKRHFPARKICYQYSDLAPEELALTDDEWHLRIQGVAVKGLWGPLKVATDSQGWPIHPPALSDEVHHIFEEGLITKAKFNDITQSCVVIDYRGSMKRLPLYDDCPEGMFLDEQECVIIPGNPGHRVSNLIQCPLYYYYNKLQGFCLRAENYERKMKPSCPTTFKLKKKFDHVTQHYEITCERTSIVPPLEIREVKEGIEILCPPEDEVTKFGDCEHTDVREPNFEDGKHKGWHSTRVLQEGMSLGYDMNRFEIIKPELTCKQRHPLRESKLLNSGALDSDSEGGDPLPMGGISGNQFRRRLSSMGESGSKDHLRRLSGGAAEEPVALELSPEAWEAMNEAIVQSSKEIDAYREFKTANACAVERIPASGARCPMGYQLTGHPGARYCRPEYHLPFAWNCDHIAGSTMGSFEDIVHDANFALLVDPEYNQFGYYCILEGTTEIAVGPSYRSKRQDQVVELNDSRKFKAGIKQRKAEKKNKTE